MKKKNLIVTAGAMMLLASGAHAQWKGEAELGITSTTGNTETTNINGKIDSTHEADKWKHNLFAEAYYAEDQSTKTAERYMLGYKPKYFVSDKDYVFGLLQYDKDEFASIDGRTSEVVGYGRQILDTDVHKLEAEIGLGARQTNYVSAPSTVGLAENEGMVYLAGKYVGKISDSAKFSQALRAEAGEENTAIESVTGLTMTIVGNLASKITYTVRHNTDIEGAKGENTDTITGVNLLYSF